MENRIFKYALIISFLIHTFILIVFWLTDIDYRKEIDEKAMEVVYHSSLIKKSEEPVMIEPAKGLKENKKIVLPKVSSNDRGKALEPVGEPQKPLVKLDLIQKSTRRLKGMGEKRHIQVPMLDSEKMMGPRYMNYHQQIREKIKNRAYFYVDDPQFEIGEVYLTFILSSDGALKQVKIIPEKTTANNYLHTISLRSIKEAAPFPPFPRDLNYPELTFNVVISFETEE
ncbi:MAG: hypothetical protein AB1650_05910 [Candidatus Omnitrophota bacterium]